MPRTAVMQTNFNAGELSPKLDGQLDLKQYFNGGREVLNFAPIPQGPLMRRTGTQYINNAYVSNEYSTRLLPFQFSETQSYILELGPDPAGATQGYIRFYTDRGLILDGGTPYQIGHPYDSAARQELQFAQTADVLIIVHPRYAPRKLVRYGHTNWVLEEISFTNPPKIDATNYYWTEANGYPGTVCFYQQRLILGGSTAYPQTIWLSVTGSYYDFTVSDPGVDTDGITYTIASDQLNSIRWMVSQKVIIIGTTGDEFIVCSSDSTSGITPSSIKAIRQTAYGSATLPAHLLEKSVVFVQYGRRKLRNVVYDYLSDTYDAEDLTSFAEHITKSQLKATTVINNPDTVLWACRKDGLLVGCTLDKDQKVVAWHRHSIAGTGPNDEAQAFVEDVCSIPGESGDEVWLVVQRKIQGVTVKMIEVLADMLRAPAEESERTYLDSYQRGTYKTPTSHITGLEHLEGEVVTPVCDGWVHPTRVVTDGAIDLKSAVSDVRVGLLYTSSYKTMRIAPSSADTVTFHLPKRLVRAWVSVYESIAPYIGVQTTYTINQIEGIGQDWVLQPVLIGDPRVMNVAQALVTKDFFTSLGVNSSTRPVFVIEAREPLPLTILAYVVDLETSDI